MATPEREARATIDRLLTAAGCAVQDYKAIDRHAARGAGIRAFVLDAGQGYADYLLYVYGQAAGVIAQKIVEGLEVALEQFRLIAADLGEPEPGVDQA